MADLASQIRTSWGGNWDLGGVDRAAELAKMLEARGITDLSQLQFSAGPTEQVGGGYVGGGGEFQDVIPTSTYTPYVMSANGQRINYLGDTNRGGDISKQDLTGDTRNTAAWSSQGSGNVSYKIGQRPDGSIGVVPVWESSSDLGSGPLGQLLSAAALMGTMYAGGTAAQGALGGGAGGATAASEIAGSYVPTGGGQSMLSVLEPYGAATLPASEPLTAQQIVGSGWNISPTVTTPNVVNNGGGGSNPLSNLTTAKTLAALAGTAAGAADSGDKTVTSGQTATKAIEPWGPAQDWLKSLIAAGEKAQTDYLSQPFSPAQQTAYGNVAGLLNSINQGAPGLLAGMSANASGANNYDRSNQRRALIGNSFNLGSWAPGLLNYFGK